jgi:hypothetical protein
MKRHHWGILALTIILLGGLAGYSLVKNGVLPVAQVNGTLLSLKTIRENAWVAQQLAKIEYAETGETLPSEQEFFVRAFENLIIHEIIRTSVPKSVILEAESRIKQGLLDRDTAELQSAIALAYEWDLETFKKRILEPKAIEDVLEEEKGESFNVWLSEVTGEANVRVWFLPYEWREGRLESK